MEKLSKDKKWFLFTEINKKLISEGIKIADYQYTKFKKLAIEVISV